MQWMDKAAWADSPGGPGCDDAQAGGWAVPRACAEHEPQTQTQTQGGIVLRGFAPSAALAPYVVGYFYYDIPAAGRAGLPAQLAVFPDTTTFACFLFGDPVRADHKQQQSVTRSAFSGFQSHRFDLLSDGDLSGITVRFTPWGANCFLPDAAEQYAELRVDSRALFRPAAVEALESQLAEQPDAQACVRQVEAFLLSQLVPQRLDPVVRRAALALLRPDGAAAGATTRLACELGMSLRTLERRFYRCIGVSPKRFARVARVQQAMRQQAMTGSWAETAVLAGYCDQSHLIRDAREILGTSPDTLVATPPTPTARAFQAAMQPSWFTHRLFL